MELDKCLEQLAEYDTKVVLIERQAPKSLVDALKEHGYSVALIDIMSTHRRQRARWLHSVAIKQRPGDSPGV